MKPREYISALEALGLSHDTVEPHLGICSRTSYRYAEKGAPKWIEIIIGLLMERRLVHAHSAELAHSAKRAD